MTKRSRLRSAAILLGAITSTSCGSASQEVLTVEEVVPRIEELNGQTVSVAGYLPRCGGYECILYRNEEDSDEWHRAMVALQNKPFKLPDHPTLNIGTGTNFDFDPKAAPFTNGYVVISGTITNECQFEGRNGCTDRGPDLKPTAIRAGSPPAG